MKFIKFWIISALIILFSISSLLIGAKRDTSQAESQAVMRYPKAVVAKQTKFSEEVKVDDKQIPFEIKHIDGAKIELGIESMKQEGKNGKKKIITTITYYDGGEYERIVDEEIIEEPVDEVIA